VIIQTTFAGPSPFGEFKPKVNNNLPALTYAQVKELRALHAAGVKYPALCVKYGHPRKTLYRAVVGRGAAYAGMP
jgi:hypothetical protein